MTTAKSPLRALKAQADKIAKMIKAAERGEYVPLDFAQKFAAARGREDFIVGVVMDDKTLKITLPWAMIRETSEVGLAAYILKHMREEREH
jgi:DNA-directed RNA polymerase subunit L